MPPVQETLGFITSPRTRPGKISAAGMESGRPRSVRPRRGDAATRAQDRRRRGRPSIEKVRAVYDWVTKNTRYVALEFGIYGFKPRRCVQTVSRGWGDCKDKATVIVTSLTELGIPLHASQVLRTQMKGDFLPRSSPSFGAVRSRHRLRALARPLPRRYGRAHRHLGAAARWISARSACRCSERGRRQDRAPPELALDKNFLEQDPPREASRRAARPSPRPRLQDLRLATPPNRRDRYVTRRSTRLEAHQPRHRRDLLGFTPRPRWRGHRDLEPRGRGDAGSLGEGAGHRADSSRAATARYLDRAGDRRFSPDAELRRRAALEAQPAGGDRRVLEPARQHVAPSSFPAGAKVASAPQPVQDGRAFRLLLRLASRRRARKVKVQSKPGGEGEQSERSGLRAA